jgi:hypothetical protein
MELSLAMVFHILLHWWKILPIFHLLTGLEQSKIPTANKASGTNNIKVEKFSTLAQSEKRMELLNLPMNFQRLKFSTRTQSVYWREK